MVATRMVQVSPTASVIDLNYGSDLVVTWRLETLDGVPLAGRVVGIYIDHGSAPFVNATTNSSGQVSNNVGKHNALYVGSTWDFDARFAGDATYEASGSPYLTVNVVSSPPPPPPPVCNEGQYYDPIVCWDGTTFYASICSGGVLVASGQTCPIQPTCLDLHPVAECIDGYWHECDNTGNFSNTNVSCEEPPPPPPPPPPLDLTKVAIIGGAGLAILAAILIATKK